MVGREEWPVDDVAVGFVLTIVSLVVFMVLSFWQLRRVHGAGALVEDEDGQPDDASGTV